MKGKENTMGSIDELIGNGNGQVNTISHLMNTPSAKVLLTHRYSRPMVTMMFKSVGLERKSNW